MNTRVGTHGRRGRCGCSGMRGAQGEPVTRILSTPLSLYQCQNSASSVFRLSRRSVGNKWTQTRDLIGMYELKLVFSAIHSKYARGGAQRGPTAFLRRPRCSSTLTGTHRIGSELARLRRGSQSSLPRVPPVFGWRERCEVDNSVNHTPRRWIEAHEAGRARVGLLPSE